jgi:hypothetical protein
MISAFDSIDDLPQLLHAGRGVCIAEGQNIAIRNSNDEPVWSEMSEVFVP